jgi:hypothetical protein
VLVRHQLLILNRGRKRAPNLRATDRIIAGLCTLFMRPERVLRSAIVLKPSTRLHLHRVLRKTKVPDVVFAWAPPSAWHQDLVEAVVAMKRRNPGWVVPALLCRSRWLLVWRSDVVRRVLSNHYGPDSDSGGPSWLTFLGHSVLQKCTGKEVAWPN